MTTPPLRRIATMADAQKTCPICGETAPEPAWLCLPRMMGEAKAGKPCTYSVEGDARGNARLAEACEALRAAVSRTNGGRDAG